MNSYKHETVVDCDYQLDKKCTKTIPANKGIPHPVYVGQEQEKVIKWACLPCDMHFDED